MPTNSPHKNDNKTPLSSEITYALSSTKIIQSFFQSVPERLTVYAQPEFENKIILISTRLLLD